VADSCWGPIDGTRESFDLFWIAVRNDLRGLGIGRVVLHATEQAIARRGGGLVWVETGGREQYASTRAFYDRCGYRLEGELRDFYAPDDSKQVYVKRVPDAPVS
jgi:ribosomal protein S18 acetylase RimI-like enzyme